MNPPKIARKRANSAKPSASSTVAAPLVAVLTPGWDDAPYLVDTRKIAAYLDVDVRTIANYAGRGMPVAVAKPRPQYHLATCLAFAAYLAHLSRVFNATRGAPPPKRINMLDAWNWRLLLEASAAPDCGNEYIVVPLRHDHPGRAQMLKDACAGLPALPDPEDDA